MSTPEPELGDVLQSMRPAILRYLRSIVRDRTIAGDLTQEVMLRAWRGGPALRDRRALPAWLYRMATHVAIEHARRPGTARTDSVAPTDPDLDLTATGGAEDVDQREMSACVRVLAADLTDAQRAALVLHDGYGYTNPEIAEILQCSLAAVKIRLHRGRARMSRLVEENCPTSVDERGVLVCESKAARDTG